MMIFLICAAVPLLILSVVWLLNNRKTDIQKLCKKRIAEEKAGSAIDYSSYSLSLSEKLKYFAAAECVLVAAGYIFFKNIYIVLILAPGAFFYPLSIKKSLIRKRKEELTSQFRDALMSISSSISAGRSVESAFKAAVDELRIIYPYGKVYIIDEFELINRKIKNNEPVEKALADLARRACADDISSFADVFAVCKATGGDLVEVIQNCCNVISQKIEIQNEIKLLVAEQKLSQKIISIVPFGLMAAIMAGSPDYAEPLYTPKGNLVMLAALTLLIFSYYIGRKIVDIKV